MRGAAQDLRAPAKAGAHLLLSRFGAAGGLMTRLPVMGPCLRRGAMAFFLAVLACFAGASATAQDRLPPAPYAYQQLRDPDVPVGLVPGRHLDQQLAFIILDQQAAQRPVERIADLATDTDLEDRQRHALVAAVFRAAHPGEAHRETGHAHSLYRCP
mgnify:CR=1 FL=1